MVYITIGNDRFPLNYLAKSGGTMTGQASVEKASGNTFWKANRVGIYSWDLAKWLFREENGVITIGDDITVTNLNELKQALSLDSFSGKVTFQNDFTGGLNAVNAKSGIVSVSLGVYRNTTSEAQKSIIVGTLPTEARPTSNINFATVTDKFTLVQCTFKPNGEISITPEKGLNANELVLFAQTFIK